MKTNKRIDPVLSARLMNLARNNLSAPDFREPTERENLEFDRLLQEARAQGLKLPRGSDLFLDDGCPLCLHLLKQDVVHALGGRPRDAGHVVMPWPLPAD